MTDFEVNLRSFTFGIGFVDEAQNDRKSANTDTVKCLQVVEVHCESNILRQPCSLIDDHILMT